MEREHNELIPVLVKALKKVNEKASTSVAIILGACNIQHGVYTVQMLGLVHLIRAGVAHSHSNGFHTCRYSPSCGGSSVNTAYCYFH